MCPFLIALFHCEIDLIKQKFFLFSDNFGQLRNFFQVGLKQKSLLVQTKKICLSTSF